LEIAGDGPERIRLEDMAGELGIAERVTFLGWQAEISTSISRWQLFVQPSHEEALGITILQAMAAGVPVVAMAVGGIPEIVVPGQTGWLVRERSPEVFAAVMRQAMDAREEREQVTKRAFELIEREFLPDKLVERLSGIYSQLVVQPARGRSAGA
jgi:glycosyltransferase involved in cell wall biosynthesis